MLGVWFSFAILPSFGSWQQRLLALCGVFTLYTMVLVTSGSLVRPYDVTLLKKDESIISPNKNL